MNPTDLIWKYYADNEPLRELLLLHSRQVAQRALEIAGRHPELHLDTAFVEQAAMLHDIGIFMTHAPGIHCHGEHPYLLHGYLGAQLMRQEGLHRVARVCERHTGTGLTAQNIIEQCLPLPVGDYRPETIEEKLICYADKFFSKSGDMKEKTPEHILASIQKHFPESLPRFLELRDMFE